MRCRTCKYWDNTICDSDKWGYCKLANSQDGVPEYTNTLAVALDYESCEARLKTNETFGCVQWRGIKGDESDA